MAKSKGLFDYTKLFINSIYIYIYIYSHDNPNITLISLFKYNILFPAHEVNVMWIHDTDLGRCSPGGGHVLCREYVPSRHIR